jgi:uncharacterized membrane protein YdcZ (DUF606 family)
MESREQQLVIIIADISGYTRFMVENQLAVVHGQLCIAFLIGSAGMPSFSMQHIPVMRLLGVTCARSCAQCWSASSLHSSRA